MADGDAAVSFNSSVIFRPSTEEVAAELPDRCKDDAGNYLEDWTAETQPTQAQVEELIDQAVRDVALRTGTQLEDEELIGSARHLVVLRARCSSSAASSVSRSPPASRRTSRCAPSGPMGSGR